MTTHQSITWQAGTSDAPLPPLVNPADQDAKHPFLALYRKFGPIFRIPGMAKPMTVLVGPEANTFIARYEDEFFKTGDIWADFDAAMESDAMQKARDGEANRQRRSSSSRRYSRAKITDKIPRIIEITHEHTQDWQPGKSIVVRSAMQRIIAEQLGQLLLHHGPGEYLQDFITYLDMTIINTFNRSNKAAFLSPEFQRAKERSYELARIIYEEHRNGTIPADEPDFINDLLAEATKYPERYNEETLLRTALGPLLAGLDTVANTCCFMIYALLKNRDAYARVIAEIDEAFAQGPLTWERLKTMQAVHGAAMETLRLYPVAGQHMMRVAQPLTFAGYRLEPGEYALLATTAPHFMEELYPDPEKFDIDRFHEPRNEHRQRGAYAPFSIGDHTCLGAGIAEVQLMVTLATLLHTYELELDPRNYELTIEHHPTATPGKNFSVKVAGLR